MLKNVLSLLLLALLAVTTLAANDYDVLNIQKDIAERQPVPFPKKYQRLLFSQKVTWDKDVGDASLFQDDASLAWIVKKAYLAMAHSPDAPKKKVNRPYVMTGMTFGKSIYFSSSIKGGSFIYYSHDENSQIFQCLLRCQAEFEEITGQDFIHNNQGSCGECMVMLQYETDTQQDITKLNPKPRIVTVRNPDKNEDEQDATIEVFDPCGTDNTNPGPVLPQQSLDLWGCSMAAKKLGFHVITDKTFKPLASIPKPVSTTQVHLQCRTPPDA